MCDQRLVAIPMQAKPVSEMVHGAYDEVAKGRVSSDVSCLTKSSEKVSTYDLISSENEASDSGSISIVIKVHKAF